MASSDGLADCPPTIPVTATHVAEKKLFVSKKMPEKLIIETHQITN